MMFATRFRLGALAVAGSALTLVPLASPASAQATPSAPPAPSPSFSHGRVVAAAGVAARSLPTTASTDYGSYPHGHRLTLICKVRGTAVDGNRLWYLVPAEGWEFVSARWVANVGAAPGYCGSADDAVGRTTTAVRTRVAPTLDAPAVRTIAGGTRLALRCSIEGSSVHGNGSWYYLTNHRWISARYVHDVGNAPTPCYPPWAG